jgi:hypothetical protein
MLMQRCLLWALAAVAPPWHLHRECSVTKPDGGRTVVRLFAEDEWLPFEGKRWWVAVDGHLHRLDSIGFETNYGPLYQSPDGNQVFVFRTFRNTIGGGLCFDLVTGQVESAGGAPASFEADGWKRRAWQHVDGAK